MKKILFATIVGLPFLAAPAQAWNPVAPIQMDAGADWHFDVNIGSACAQPKCPTCPWYTYFPYQAYFQMPAPVGGYAYPFWPQAMTTRQAPGMLPAPNPGPAQSQNRPLTPPPGPHGGIQPAGYYSEIPGYWYGE